MSNAFYRKPVIGADENNWGPYNDAHILNAVGLNSCKLYDDAGTLKISKGRIGIDNGTNKGSCDIDTVTSISLAAVTNSNWAKIEIEVSGTAVSFSASDTNTGVDTAPEIIPSGFKSAFDESKQGFYITATKRTVGLVWLDSSGNLAGIINANNYESYSGYTEPEATDNSANSVDCRITFIASKDTYRASGICEIGDWNMDTTAEVIITLGISTFKNIRNCEVIIRSDLDDIYDPLARPYYSNLGAISDSGSYRFATVGGLNIDEISLRRGGGGIFDSASYNSTSYNRGWIFFELEE